MLDNVDMTRAEPAQRHIGLVPQDTVLFPTMTVREHLAFSPTVRKWPCHEIKNRVEELAESLGISHLLGRHPQGLSGGESKRVALGRALASRPKLLCLDEALTGLDDETHAEIIELIRSTIQNQQVTVLHITHHRAEAESLTNTLFTMSKGKLIAN